MTNVVVVKFRENFTYTVIRKTMDKNCSKEKFIEKASGNLGTSIVATLVAASGGTYLAPLVPILVSSLANIRYKKRVEDALGDLDFRLSKYEEAVVNMSDNQFKLVGESINSILHTTEDAKIKILKNAVVNSINTKDIHDHEASILGRALRDISSLEFNFLNIHKGFKEITVLVPRDEDSESQDGQIVFAPDSEEAQLLAGLVNLNLVILLASGFGGTLNYQYTPIAYKLLELCENETIQ